ncbi:hypothetical protein MLD38_032091 [Melastoma candidum]|uniref:Uncharacterized protein n=1 Tax=Melastoma candidum TaxID=119954 RepID=A0ACB9M4J6_9MYRT|nr:hypothetical protein MLD38_032091 [Melastoma candidum]
MEFVPEKGKRPPPVDCTSLILPALSIGNVGQLAVDLLISTWRAERVGYLDDPNVLPCVGNDPYSPVPSGDLALPLEAYVSGSNGPMLIQQRSPIVKGMMIEFAKNLAEFAASSGKKDVVILSGLDFGRWQRIDTSGGSQTYYLSSVNSDGYDDRCEKFGWKRLPEYNPDQKSWNYLRASAEGTSCVEEGFPGEDDLEEEDYYPSLPFSALFSFFKAKGLNVTCLLCYCSEGDNIPDSFHLAEASCKLFGIRPTGEGDGWLIPYSWQTVYGPPPDVSIF